MAVPRPVSYYFWGAGGATYFGAGNNNATTIDGIFASGVPYSSFATTCLLQREVSPARPVTSEPYSL